MIGRIVQDTENSVPFEHRENVWHVLEFLTSDPDPSEADDAKSSADPAQLSINLTSGEAFHAVFKYGLWVVRHLKTDYDEKEIKDKGFKFLPEVRNALERGLDLSIEPRLVIRAVFGQWFPWVQFIDHGWAENNLESIFPSSHEYRSYWFAAWSAYIRFNVPYNDVYPIFKEKYRFAVEHLTANDGGDDDFDDTGLNGRLAGHLMTYYWRGLLTDEFGKALVSEFCERSSPDLKKATIKFIGISLKSTTEDIPDDVSERLISFWDNEVSIAQGGIDLGSHAEFAEFGWWFSSGKLDNFWSLTNLELVIDNVGLVTDDWNVIEQLARVSAEYPLEASRCMLKFFTTDQTVWIGHKATACLNHMFDVVRQSGNVEAIKIAIKLADNLGELGHLDFKDNRRELAELLDHL